MNVITLLKHNEGRYFELRKKGHSHDSAIAELRYEEYNGGPREKVVETAQDDPWWHA